MWDDGAQGVAGPVDFGNGIGGWWEWVGALAVRIVSFCCIMAGKEWKEAMRGNFYSNVISQPFRLLFLRPPALEKVFFRCLIAL